MNRAMNSISALIIDDCEIDRYLLKRHLKELGIVDIFEQDDGSTALEFFKNYEENRKLYPEKFPPVLIFLDINMPNIGGFEFLTQFEEIRNKFALESCVIMMYSSSEHQEDKDRAADFKFVKGFITKGELTAEQLKDKIQAL